jgi:hypothetical protein
MSILIPITVGCPTKVKPEGNQEARICPRCHNGVSHSILLLQTRNNQNPILPFVTRLSCNVRCKVQDVVRVVLRPAHPYELETYLDVWDLSGAGERAAWVRELVLLCDGWIVDVFRLLVGGSLRLPNLGTSTRSYKASTARPRTRDTTPATSNPQSDTPNAERAVNVNIMSAYFFPLLFCIR